jgi:NAD(P)-dependent dehydrogenase (short-subunit alcohol dehydrogenase family)
VVEIEATGRQAVAIAANAADPAAVENSVQAAAKELGGLDILVNNAGIGRVGILESMSLSDIQALLDVNIRSAILACRSAIPHRFQPTYKCKDNTIWIYLAEDSLRPPPVSSQLGLLLLAQPYK